MTDTDDDRRSAAIYTKTGTPFGQRVAERAGQVRVAGLLLSLLALPFYVLGLAAACVWVLIAWSIAAVQVGFAEVNDRRPRRVSDADDR
jgi:hypothetical protein